ncbi:MAG TPA: hypothetical protein VF214_04390 [Edaphobacter sp.]
MFTSVAARSQAPPSNTHGRPAKADQRISTGDLARLRPVVQQDLKTLLAHVYNDDNLSAADLEDEFQQCKFTPLALGALGPAVLVEAGVGHGMANATMLNIYVPSHGTYRRVAEAAGFGPRIVPGPERVPDLVFGWASGVCHATFQRYRYQSGKYVRDACDQEYDNGDCAIKSCIGLGLNLPTFPNPWPEQ